MLAGNQPGGPRDTRVLPTDPPRTGVSRRGLLIGGVLGLAATAGVGSILWATRSTPRLPRWSVDVPGTARLSVTDGVAYLLGHDSTVRAIASRDGAVRWTYALQDANRRYTDKSLAVGGSYFIEDRPGLCAIDLATGRLRWSLTSIFLVTALP